MKFTIVEISDQLQRGHHGRNLCNLCNLFKSRCLPNVRKRTDSLQKEHGSEDETIQ